MTNSLKEMKKCSVKLCATCVSPFAGKRCSCFKEWGGKKALPPTTSGHVHFPLIVLAALEDNEQLVSSGSRCFHFKNQLIKTHSA